jgi:hypothetical protein
MPFVGLHFVTAGIQGGGHGGMHIGGAHDGKGWQLLSPETQLAISRKGAVTIDSNPHRGLNPPSQPDPPQSGGGHPGGAHDGGGQGG